MTPPHDENLAGDVYSKRRLLKRGILKLIRIKVRRFRIVYAPDRKARLIRIFTIAHRREVYEKTAELLRLNQK
jgi:mRNA-degrading endonuclease RelE of RelBE toxin-antitoxin system